MPTAQRASELDHERAEIAADLSGQGMLRREVAEYLRISAAALAASLSRVRAETNRRVLAGVTQTTPAAPSPPPAPRSPEPPPAPPAPEPRRPTPPPAAPASRPRPPMSQGAVGRVRDPAHLAAISEAYFDPVTRVDQDERYTVQWSSTVRLVVAKDTGTIVHVGDHQEATGRSEVFVDRPKPAKRRKPGGGGHLGHLPRTVDDLIERCREEGCAVERDGGDHYRVSRGRKSVTVPRTPSDTRSIPNACSSVRKDLGIELRRGGTRGGRD